MALLGHFTFFRNQRNQGSAVDVVVRHGVDVTITFGVRTVVRVFVNKVHYAKSRYSANNTEYKVLRIVVKRNYKIRN